MKSLVQTINESLQVLYHFSSISGLIKLLEADEFRAAEDDGYNPDRRFKYYISTTRTQYGGQGIAWSMNDMPGGLAKLVLDGTALQARYKIVPMTYTNAKWWPIKANWEDPDMFDAADPEEIKRQASNESEDRIMLKQPTVPKFASRYIEKIILDQSTVDPDKADQIVQLAKKLNIQVVFAKNKSSWDRAH